MSERTGDTVRRKVLVAACDGPDGKVLVERLQGAGYKAVVCPAPEQLQDMAVSSRPDLIVIELPEDDLSRCNTLGRLAEDGRTKPIPALVLRRRGQRVENAPECAADSMCWPVGANEFATRVRAMLRIAYGDEPGVTPADRDALTRVYNRRYFEERMDKEVERARRYGRKVSCVTFDVDSLGSINSRFGHEVGDEALRGLADVLLSETRQSDIVARYGAGEFAVILPETEARAAGVMAERLRASFGQRSPVADLPELVATMSCGVATYPDHARDAATLVRMADSAMYQAKQGGRNRTVVAFGETEGSTWSDAEGGARILLVEGNDYSRNVASVVLRANGYEVIEAADGPTALFLAKSSRPDLVIIDVQLDGMSGLEAARRLVQMEETRCIPVVALTAQDMPRDLEELVRAGCRGYITKPIDTNSLAAQIQSYLQR
jgi:diguanylate cyclase (GGDEF)-like protein